MIANYKTVMIAGFHVYMVIAMKADCLTDTIAEIQTNASVITDRQSKTVPDILKHDMQRFHNT